MDRRAFVASGALLAFAGTARAQPAPAPFVTDARVALGAYRTAVDEHLQGVLRALKALAATSDARSGRWTDIRPGLAALAADLPTAAAVFFAAPDGAYSTVERGPTGLKLTDRDYFPGLMDGMDVRGSLVVSRSTGERSAVVATPVKTEEAEIGALGVSVSVRAVSDLIGRGAGLPPDLVFYALDATGRTAIHKDPALMFEFPSDLGDQTLKSAVRTMLAAPEGRVDYDFRGTHRTAVFDRSPFTGWTFVLAAVRPGA
jgi:methyl-accepting chemotaxis protein